MTIVNLWEYLSGYNGKKYYWLDNLVALNCTSFLFNMAQWSNSSQFRREVMIREEPNTKIYILRIIYKKCTWQVSTHFYYRARKEGWKDTKLIYYNNKNTTVRTVFAINLSSWTLLVFFPSLQIPNFVSILNFENIVHIIFYNIAITFSPAISIVIKTLLLTDPTKNARASP